MQVSNNFNVPSWPIAGLDHDYDRSDLAWEKHRILRLRFTNIQCFPGFSDQMGIPEFFWSKLPAPMCSWWRVNSITHFPHFLLFLYGSAQRQTYFHVPVGSFRWNQQKTSACAPENRSESGQTDDVIRPRDLPVSGRWRRCQFHEWASPISTNDSSC